jgi:hypothetical protein
MAVTCKSCELSPVVCQFSSNGLELIYCESCIEAVIMATHNVYELNESDPSDLALLDEAERRLQDLVDKGEWKP